MNIVHKHLNNSDSCMFQCYDVTDNAHIMEGLMFEGNIDYLIVGLRYGLYPRVTDVIS